MLSKALGSQTALSGSVSQGKDSNSQSLQMMERPLLTADELKSLPKGEFVVMKTGTHSMRTRLRLFLDRGITFEKEGYQVPERAARKGAYANRVDLERNLPQYRQGENDDGGSFYAVAGHGGMSHEPAQECSRRRGSSIKTMGEEER